MGFQNNCVKYFNKLSLLICIPIVLWSLRLHLILSYFTVNLLFIEIPRLTEMLNRSLRHSAGDDSLRVSLEPLLPTRRVAIYNVFYEDSTFANNIQDFLHDYPNKFGVSSSEAIESTEWVDNPPRFLIEFADYRGTNACSSLSYFLSVSGVRDNILIWMCRILSDSGRISKTVTPRCFPGLHLLEGFAKVMGVVLMQAGKAKIYFFK